MKKEAGDRETWLGVKKEEIGEGDVVMSKAFQSTNEEMPSQAQQEGGKSRKDNRLAYLCSQMVLLSDVSLPRSITTLTCV